MMTDNAILWVLLIGAVFWYGWRRGKNRRQGAASAAAASSAPMVNSSLLGFLGPAVSGAVFGGMNYDQTHDPRSAQNWPKPASTPPDPQLGLPDLSII